MLETGTDIVPSAGYEEFKRDVLGRGGKQATIDVINRFHKFQSDKRFFETPFPNQHPKNFPLFELNENELRLWQEEFGVEDILQERLKHTELFTPQLSNTELEQFPSNIGESPSKSLAVLSQKAGENIVNLFYRQQFRDVPVGEARHVEGADDVVFYAFPQWFHANFGAGIYLEINALDKNGMPLVEQYATTMNGGPIFGHVKLLVCALRFNHRIDKQAGNFFANDRYKGRRKDFALAVDVNINDPSQISGMQIPDDSKVRLSFWQVNQYMSDPNAGLLSSPQSEKLDE